MIEQYAYLHAVAATTSAIADDLLEGVQWIDRYLAARRVVQSQVLVGYRGDGMYVQGLQECSIERRVAGQIVFFGNLNVVQERQNLVRGVYRRHGGPRWRSKNFFFEMRRLGMCGKSWS